MPWLTYVRRSLKWKFMLLVLLLIIVLVSSIGYFSYYESSRTIRSDVSLFSEQILKQANLNLNQYFLDYEYGFLVFGLSYEFEHWLTLTNRPEDEYERFLMESRIESKFVVPYSSQFPELLSVSIYNDNGMERVYRHNREFPKLNYTVKEESWFPHISFAKGIEIFVHETDIYEGVKAAPVITMVKKFEHLGSSGLVKIDISPSRAMQIIGEIELGANSAALISDPGGQVLLRPGNMPDTLAPNVRDAVSAADAGSFYDKTSDRMIVYQTLPYTGWKTLVTVPYANVAESVYRVRDFTVIVAAIHFMFAVLVIWIISSSLTSRLLRLKEGIKEMRIGNLGKRIPIDGVDEVAELGAAFNRMVYDLEDSMQELAASRLLQQQAILSALQSQIHSHFMYNALESINAMANLIEHEEIMDMTVALSDMLRYTSNYKQEHVAVRDEMKHAEDFVRIMNLMHGDRIALTIAMEEDMQELQCLKAIVQPLVENCLKHGFEQTGRAMRIEVRLTAWEQHHIAIAVQDDGSGFAPDKLKALQLALQGAPSDYRNMPRVGLLNVHYRVKVYAKDDVSGVTVANAKDGGAMVTIVLPRIAHMSGQSLESKRGEAL